MATHELAESKPTPADRATSSTSPSNVAAPNVGEVALPPVGIQDRNISPAQALALQRIVGNSTTVRVPTDNQAKTLETPSAQSPLQRSIDNSQLTIQRKMWDNVPMKFQTENDLGAANSEYDATGGGYRRFAPVNIVRRILDQVYHASGDRNFAYFTGMPHDVNDPKWNAVYESTKAEVAGNTVTFTSRTMPKAEPAIANREPSEGAVVFDATIGSDGVAQPDVHVGHSVAQLGQPLPTLDDPLVLAEVMERVRRLRSGGQPAPQQRDPEGGQPQAKAPEVVEAEEQPEVEEEEEVAIPEAPPPKKRGLLGRAWEWIKSLFRSG